MAVVGSVEGCLAAVATAVALPVEQMEMQVGGLVVVRVLATTETVVVVVMARDSGVVGLVVGSMGSEMDWEMMGVAEVAEMAQVTKALVVGG